MGRVWVAAIGGLVAFTAYVLAVATVADAVLRLHWVVQAAFFLVAGAAWVPPVRWLMLWAAHRR